jgi:hypothetical protein
MGKFLPLVFYLLQLSLYALYKYILNHYNIFYNPVKAGLCNLSEEYYFSSALFYSQNAVHEKGIDHFGFIEHYLG